MQMRLKEALLVNLAKSAMGLANIQVGCQKLSYLSLILQTTRIQKQFSLSGFVFIDSFVVSALQDAGGYAISRQNNLIVAFGLPYLLIELFYIGMPVVRTDGLSGGRSVYGPVITKFSRMGRLLYFLTHGAPLARFARELRYNGVAFSIEVLQWGRTFSEF